MPELPEVEVVKRGLEKEILQRPFLLRMEFRRPDLRHKIPQKKLQALVGEKISWVRRRAKFLLFKTETAGFLSHLGMTGTWRMSTSQDLQLGTHDHIVLSLGKSLKDPKPHWLIYRDPRRFGIFDHWSGTWDQFGWGEKLAPEPLSQEFHADYLYACTRHRLKPIKSFIMDQAFVVGVGNIYASESLFLAGIRPTRKAQTLTRAECQVLTKNIKDVLEKAIAAGGSSISDFKTFYGNPGEYHLQHFVYDREGQACRKCNTSIKSKVLSGRSTYWCTSCQE